MIDFSFHSDLPDGLLELVRDHISRLKGLDEPERHIVGYATKQMDIMSFRGDSLNGKNSWNQILEAQKVGKIVWPFSLFCFCWPFFAFGKGNY